MVTGSYFGEVDVIYNVPRSYDTFASKDIEETELLSLERNKFLDSLESYPEIADEILSCARVRKSQIEERQIEVLEAMEYHH